MIVLISQVVSTSFNSNRFLINKKIVSLQMQLSLFAPHRKGRFSPANRLLMRRGARLDDLYSQDIGECGVLKKARQDSYEKRIIKTVIKGVKKIWFYMILLKKITKKIDALKLEKSVS